MKNLKDYIVEGVKHYGNGGNHKSTVTRKGGKVLMKFFTGYYDNPTMEYVADDIAKKFCGDVVDNNTYKYPGSRRTKHDANTTYKDADVLFKDLIDSSKEWDVTYDQDDQILTFTCGKNTVELDDVEFNDIDTFFHGRGY